MKKITYILMIAGSALLAGCKSAPNDSAPRDLAAKKFQPESGKASLYVIRKATSPDDTTLLQTVLDGQITDSLAADTYLMFSVAPGDHDLTIGLAPSEHIKMTPGRFKGEAEYRFTAEPGKIYFFDASLRLNWVENPGVYLSPLGEAEGRAAVSASTRAAVGILD